uniref:Telomerase reverse transcriptase n=1 Tax=Chenopodium quinoa TaxID=63459 RepID=A0A803LJI9_CHEQI
MGKKKKERVPNVLWRQFRDKAASLSKTIISIIPKFCNCNGKGKCIRCVFGNGDDEAAMSYLIRPDDPIDYRRLMTTCFVVVPQNAPPFSPLSSFTRHWSQLQIVEKTIQALFNKAIAPSNVLCHGYQKFKLNSTIVKVLTNWTWELALKRVGDSIMIHLLMHTLIFMSIKCNAHQQVAGPLVSQLVARLPMRIPLDDSGSSMHETDANSNITTVSIVQVKEKVFPVHSLVCVNGTTCSDKLHGLILWYVVVVVGYRVSGSATFAAPATSPEDPSHLTPAPPQFSTTLPQHHRHTPPPYPIHHTPAPPQFSTTLPQHHRTSSSCKSPDLGFVGLVVGFVGLVMGFVGFGGGFGGLRKWGWVLVVRGVAVFIGDWCCVGDCGGECYGAATMLRDWWAVVCWCFKGKGRGDEKGLGGAAPAQERGGLDVSECGGGDRGRQGYKRKRGRGNGKISKSEEPASKVPCRTGQENSFGSVDSEIVDCHGKNSPKVITMISEKCLHGQNSTEEKPIERLKVEPRKRLRLPSWQRRKRRKKLALQDCCTQEPSRKNLNDVGDFHKNFQHGLVNNKGQSLVVPTSVENKDNQNGADLYSEQLLCPCCSVFQSLSRVPKDAEISRKFMFYNVKYSSSLFLKKHILYSLKPGFAGVSDLLLHISGFPNTSSRNVPASCFHKRGLCSQGSICLAKKCQHIRLLEKHCPSQPLFQLDRDGDVGSSLEPSKMESELSKSKQDVFQGTDQMPKRLTCIKTRGHKRTTEVIQRQFGLSRPYCLKDEVVSYIWAVCRNIVPPDLLGLPLSRRILRRNISKFIKLRRFEKFSLKQCLHKLEVSKFPLLSNIEASKCSNAFVFKPTTDQISVDNFYVTESELGKQNLCYYRKSTWQKLSDRVITSLKDQTYRSLNNASVAEILSKRSFGFSKSVNTVLRDLQVIFKDLKVKEPERWGSTVFSYNDIHRKFCSFLRHLKEGQPTMPMVYIVVSDVKKAFDTVKQDKLLSVIDEIQMADKYSLQKSCEIFCRKKSLWISENRKLMIEGNNSGLTEDIPPVHQRTCQTVVMNKEQGMTVRREELKYNLKEHLKNNVLKLECQDMPIQVDNGSAALVATSVVSFSSPKYLLLRFVDDFLFVSTSKKQASSFFSRLRRGFHAYNCYMNQEKFCMNFDYGGTHKVDSKRLLVGSDGVSFMQWSGLLINSCTLEVQADYSRYLNDHMSSTLTVSWQHRPGRQLKAKLRAYMRPKCNPIFYDTSINSPATIRLNVYQAFVVCAMKFHCYVRELSFWCKLQPGSCLSSIEGSIRYMYRLMKRRMYKVNYEPDCNQVLQVAKQEVIWLGLTAYIRVLSKKKSQTCVFAAPLKSQVGGNFKCSDIFRTEICC